MTRLLNRYTWVLLMLSMYLVVQSCTQERDPCLQPKTVTLRMGTYKPADTGALGVDSVLPAAIIGMVDSNYLFYQGTSNSKFQLLLSPLADSVRWFIRPDSNAANKLLADTIVFHYKKNLHFISTGCGYNYYYTLSSITQTDNYIDSIKINNAEITTDANVEHVKIFY